MQAVQASIITIGDELLIGQTIDTNSAFIAQHLNAIGIWVQRRVAVGDVYEDIWNALDQECKHSRIVIITGGLGPTADDITKPLLCHYFGGHLVLNQQVLQHIQYLFEQVYRRPGALLERNRAQAAVPDVCTLLHNALGTAPGMWFEKQSDTAAKTIVIALPGVPHEMKGLMMHEVVPRLKNYFSLPAVLHSTAITYGMGESSVAERLQNFEAQLPPHIKLAYLPDYGMVKLRLTAKGTNEEVLKQQLYEQFHSMTTLLHDIVIATADEPMEAIVGALLHAKNKTVATAESCTGGAIAHCITQLPGSSAYYKGSIIAYDNAVKENLLQVAAATLTTAGAVSQSTVTQMAQGALQQLSTDYAIATSGIMGPAGGTPEKPTGTVWIAVANKQKVATKLLQLRFDRTRNITITTMQALNFLRQFIIESETT